MTYWRQAGLNYIQYSNIAARIVRRVLKPEQQADAMKREESVIKVAKWKDGKPQIKEAEQ